MNHYPLGSIWRQRDGKEAVVISGVENGLIWTIETNQGRIMPYQVHADTGRFWSEGDSHCDLIHRADGMEAADLLDAAEAVVGVWPTGQLAEAVQALDSAARDMREAA